MKPTPTPWTLGQINKRSQTAFIDAMHPDPDLKHVDWRDMIQCNGCYDSPEVGIEKAEANARYIVKAVNYHARLVEALRKITRPHGVTAHYFDHARALLAELDNLEQPQ